MPPRAAPRSMKQRPPWTRGDFRGVGAVTDNLVWVVDPETHPGAARPLSLRATPPTEGILRGTLMNNAVSLKSLAKMIDHSLLHPTMTNEAIIAGCELSKRYDVATACVKPYATRMASDVLRGSSIKVCSVIAFPHGNSTTAIKVLEAESAVREGASEIDMVVNLGKALGGDWGYVSEDIRVVNEVVVSSGALLKVIFENDYLADEHIIKLCEICASHAVAFVKTSRRRIRVCETTQWNVFLPRRNGSPASTNAPALSIQRSVEGCRRCAEFG